MRLPGLAKRAAAIAELPALGLLTLAGMLPEHWSCRYRACENMDDGFVEAIVSEKPDLVAVSALTASIDEAYTFARKLRQRNIPVVIGGLHATVCPEEARQHCDAVVVGNAEPVWRQVLGDAESHQLSGVYRTPDNVKTIDWPMPRFDLLCDRPQRFTLQTQRGCPFACDFCGASRLLGQFREKPIDRIRAELDAIRRIDPRPLIELADDNTFAGTRDASELLAVLGDAGARWFTESDWRIGERPELLTQLANSGCVQVLVGIESLVFRYPGMGQKQAELNRIMNAVEAIQSAGVAVNGCFIVGAEGETPASLERMVEFILNSPLAEVQLTLQTPFPGTGLYEKLKRESRLLAERGWNHYTLFDVTYRPDRMSVEQLEHQFRESVRHVFSPAATSRRERIRREVLRNRPRCRSAPLLGFVLVLSAGFAREYDGEDLLYAPWHLLLPLAASLVTSFILLALLMLFAMRPESGNWSFLQGYRAFLGLYWLTAPLAWLYAIPVERFLPAGEATRMNLFLLAVVSIWRVALITRVISVLYGVSALRAFFPVMLFADAIAVLLLLNSPLPIISIMGGIRLTESEQAIRAASNFILVWGILTSPVWLLATLISASRHPQFTAFDVRSNAAIAIPVWGIAIGSMLIWLPILTVTQPEQQLRRKVEVDLHAGRIYRAIELMSKHKQADFPPHWDPPPRPGYGEEKPELSAIGKVIRALEPPDWVRNIFKEKGHQAVTGPLANKSVCYICRNGSRPVVMLLMRRMDPELKPLLQQVSRLVDRNRAAGLRGFGVLISSDAVKATSKVQTFAFNNKVTIPLTVGGEGVGYEACQNVHAEAAVTVVLYRRQKVVDRFAFREGELGTSQVKTVVARVKRFVADDE
eukprot:g21933.t1